MENESLKQELAQTKESHAAQASIIADGREREWKLEAEIENLKSKIQNLESQLADRDAELAAVAADRADLAQFKKEAKEAAAEVHREGMAIKALETQWQQQLSDARGELADAKATILNQNDKIRELERGYSLKPNPADEAVMREQRLEIGNLRAELADLKQNSALIAIELPDLKTVHAIYKTERKPGRTFTITELKPFYAAILKALTPNKGN
ncbi:hypothetical protein [Microcoleus sp. AT9b-C3]|uniref:hypothetical protein n=1 Tax=Microcoleus sp. AT9b-C3 TaxID=2818629 RepID=UPI002FD19D31